MSTGHCRRLLAALQHAIAQDTRVLVLRGGTETFSNGIHLNVIAAAADPATTAWVNIRAVNAVCREILTCARQVVIAGYAGSAGAGGAMLGLGADLIAARAGIVLNPYYDIGLFGSELHTYTLPRRVGAEAAQRLIDEKLPVGADRAAALGLVDLVGPRHPEAYTQWLTALAEAQADPHTCRARRAAKAKRLAGERVPLDAYEARELAEMSRDLYGDRSGFAAARLAFVSKAKPAATPALLALPVFA
jgi:putative two-component system hydrogenase maturation factor HypX/HoxX